MMKLEELLVGISTIIGSVFGLYYVVGSLVCLDPFFFLRKRMFFRKMKKTDYKTVEEFLGILLDSNSWEMKGRNSMIMYPFSNKNTKFVFSNNGLEMDLVLYEKNRRICHIENWIKIDSLFFEVFLKKSDNKIPNRMRLKDILEHLNSILQPMKKEITENNKRQEEEEREKLIHQMNTYQNSFQSLLHSDALWEGKDSEPFHIEMFQGKNHIYVSLFFKHTPLFNCSWKDNEFRYEFLNQDRHSFLSIQGCEEEIVSYFYQKIKNETQQSLDMKVSVYEAKRKVEQQMEELLSSRKWLSHEQIHKLSHTYPHDLESLFSTYQELKQPEKMEKVILSSLDSIRSSLKQMEHEMEEEKQKQIMQRKEIIQLRN